MKPFKSSRWATVTGLLIAGAMGGWFGAACDAPRAQAGGGSGTGAGASSSSSGSTGTSSGATCCAPVLIETHPCVRDNDGGTIAQAWAITDLSKIGGPLPIQDIGQRVTAFAAINMIYQNENSTAFGHPRVGGWDQVPVEATADGWAAVNCQWDGEDQRYSTVTFFVR